MKKLFEEKSHMISKLFVYQIAMSLLGIFVVTPFINSSSAGLCLSFGIFAMLFYYSLVCYAIVEDAQNDHISASSGRKQGSAWTGFKYALVSYIPTIVFVIAFIIIMLTDYKAELTGFPFVLGLIIRIFFMGSYSGVHVYLYELDGVWRYMCNTGIFFGICLVVMPVVAGCAYALAYKGKIHINTAAKKMKKLFGKKDSDSKE